ncbi:TPA: cell filamentation protein Fic [Candidatus Peribacteria bacterium]|nr:MAG: hypothetical protein A2529_04760 [Candidatus Peribacteria bacterium RIFOXYD2_FULL_58_15]HAI98802.1 cell filamentation protein Fic [Candidatus Peribacteria bacterium]HAS34076.1 cell filamentation protein Fic [Candidatus Peribacteria bacterium]
MKPFDPKHLPLTELQWERFVHLIGPANAEVARFDGLLQSLPNPQVLLSPLETNEAVLSSKIEGTEASLEDVLRFEAEPERENKKGGDIDLILNYRRAMRHSIQNMENISLSGRLIKEAHAILLENVRGHNADRGNFRRSQVHIGRPGRPIEEAFYIPPPPQEVESYFSNLEKYIHGDEKDKLVQLAIIHAQFELIHPFADGNGRVGRMLMPLFLSFKGVLSSPMFYISEYFESHRREYYDGLLGISQHDDWNGWISYFLRAVIEQSKMNIQKARAIHQLYDKKKERLRALTHSQYTVEALDFLFKNPIFNSTDFITTSRIPRATALRILQQLQKGGTIDLVRKGVRGRPALFVFPKLIAIV